MRPIVELTPADVEAARRCGELRHAINAREIGEISRFAGSPDTSPAAHFLGALAETAFARWLGVPDTLAIVERPDPGYDFIVRGYTVNVKGTKYATGNLIDPAHARPFVADRYVLVTAPNVLRPCIVGWCSLEEWYARHRVIKGKYAVLTREFLQEWLHGMETFAAPAPAEQAVLL